MLFKIVRYKEIKHIPLNMRRILRTGIYLAPLTGNVSVRNKTFPYFWTNVVDGRYFKLCVLCKLAHGERIKKRRLP